MKKQCPECRTIVDHEIHRCESCGYAFREFPEASERRVALIPADLKLFFGALAIFAIAIVVVGFLRVL